MTSAVGVRLAGRFEVRAHVRAMPGYVEWHALDLESDSEVAVWSLEPALFGAIARDVLVGELDRLRGLKHPALRRLLAIGEDATTEPRGLWAVYPQAEPGPVPRGGAAMPADQVVAWVKAVAAALDAAHQAGWSHGRLVPDDVSLVRGHLALGGVGLWHDIEPGPATTAWQALAAFLAPEVRDGVPPTPAADAWGLAAGAAAFLCGARYGCRDPQAEVAERHPALARALAGGLTIEPERRVSVRDLALRIADAARHPGRAPGRPTAPASPPPPAGPQDADVLSPDQVTGAIARARTAAPIAPGALQAVSMRPGGERARPATGEDAGGEDETARRARIRPIAETVGRSFATAPGALGYMAPPRDAVATPRRGRALALVAGAVVVAGLAAVAIVLAASGGGGSASGGGGSAPGPGPGGGEPATDGVDAAPLADVAPARACTADMPALGGWCIDAHEAPGPGRLPRTGVTLTEARDACRARGLRLCRVEEWRAACGGPRSTPWPYGETFQRGACNLGPRGMIAKAGSFERCVGAAGVHDLTGNVAEWLADGTIAGGSAVDGGPGRCDDPVRAAAPAARAADVGYRCCGDR